MEKGAATLVASLLWYSAKAETTFVDRDPLLHPPRSQHQASSRASRRPLGRLPSGREQDLKKLGLTHAESGHTGYADDCIPVFDPGFEAHCTEICREQLSTLKDDPWLVGVFSDNELPTPEDLLDRMLNRPGASQAAAKAFLGEKTEITDELRRTFIEHIFEAYFRSIFALVPAFMVASCASKASGLPPVAGAMPSP